MFNRSSLALDSEHYCTAFNDRYEFKVLARIDFIYISLSLQDALQLGVGFSVEKVVQLEGERSNAATVLQPYVMHTQGLGTTWDGTVCQGESRPISLLPMESLSV